jgi:sirohydrochlorin cobaltochelatase
LKQPSGTQAVILFAHGSRDPLWRKPIEDVAARVGELSPLTTVRCAYLELTEPDLLSCATELAALQLQSVTIVPMFLGVGRHVREDLPSLMAQLVAAHPQIQFRLLPSVGEDQRLVALLAEIALTQP